MPEPNRLDAFASEMRARVVPPDFDALAAVGRRRRRMVVSATATVAAAVLILGGVGIKALSSDGHATPPTDTGPKTARVTAHRAPSQADRIVDSEHSVRISTAVLPGNPSAIASVWAHQGHGNALAVTDDGYQHRTTMLLRRGFPRVSAAGSDWFFVGQASGGLVISPSTDTRKNVRVGPTGPLADGEYLVQRDSGTAFAVNPTTATGHAIPLPPGSHGVAYGDRSLLWTIAFASVTPEVHSAVEWSTDGGATWSSHELPSGQLAIFAPVPSAPGTMALSEVGDGNTIPTLSRLIVSRDAGATWQTYVEHGKNVAPTHWSVVLPDGRLLVRAAMWPGGVQALSRRGGFGAIIRSTGTDWTDLSRVHARATGALDNLDSAVADLETVVDQDGAMTIYVQDGISSGDLVKSSDGGTTWTWVRGR